ncbi:hypothetical protein F5148DRAFT_597707 [Russula earlei]|uniref:Uncharacterized protein n=1 Tax=Russula earlei TaxID=71964 RepID=A0ACC0TV48_9AGAM|nr:hypothetical protein F5148DRAFT_597707 [Russula earlei]
MGLLADVPTAVTSTSGPLLVANNFRIASLSIAAYDYLVTLPAEIRLYSSSSRRSLGCVLFVLIRYTSMITMIASNVGFFDHHFSPQVCGRYSNVAPVFKVLQVMVSQAILGVRAYNISLRNVWVRRIIVPVYVVVVGIQWFAALDKIRDCGTAVGNKKYSVLAWLFYLAAMLFDCLALSISTVFLLKMRPAAIPGFTASKLLGILIFDGLGYLVVLTAVNLMNVFLLRDGTVVTGTAGVSLGYAFTWIMSQRILLHLRKEKARQQSVYVSQLPTCTPVQVCVEMKHMSDGEGTETTDLQTKSYNPPSEFEKY